MDVTTTVKPEVQPPRAAGTPETPVPLRRPFAQPALQDLGELKELTQLNFTITP